MGLKLSGLDQRICSPEGIAEMLYIKSKVIISVWILTFLKEFVKVQNNFRHRYTHKHQACSVFRFLADH